MPRKKLLVIVVLIALATLLVSLAQAAKTDQAERAQRLVHKAVAYVESYGSEAAITAFHDPNGVFIDGELYILFYAFNGDCLANGAKPELAGLNRYDVHDPDGVYQIREMIELAKKEGGWVRYKYDNPVSGRVEPKATYVLRAPGMDAFIGCGIYGTP
ncbi:MAG: cache domain-containing protein [Proteobacteria bacterium]|nr:cache domain-containing protein [Pseudomonadota bacterium]